MATSTTSVTAAEIMDRAAVLMNDADKTDYTYDKLLPLLNMSIDELMEHMLEAQSSPTTATSAIIQVPVGFSELYPVDSVNTLLRYPLDLVEIQEIGERMLGSEDQFIQMIRKEYLPVVKPVDALLFWVWENQVIKFNAKGATTPREVQIKYLKYDISQAVDAATKVSTINSRSYLAYKTAAFAAMFIGENPARAKVLDDAAEDALERMTGINNKGRQQIMTRHRPFRAAYKARSGYY